MSSLPRNPEPPGDRRSDRRYSAEAPLEYSVLAGSQTLPRATGRLINISSGGILFQPASPVEPGVSLELVIAWPARHPAAPLQLHIVGQTLRREGNCTAVRILRYDFQSRPPDS